MREISSANSYPSPCCFHLLGMRYATSAASEPSAYVELGLGGIQRVSYCQVVLEVHSSQQTLSSMRPVDCIDRVSESSEDRRCAAVRERESRSERREVERMR